MKNRIIILVGLLAYSFLVNAQVPVFTQAKIEKAKVYFSGVELLQSANLKLPKGNSEVVITNVASGIDTNTIRLKSNPDVTVMSVQYVTQYLKDYDNPEMSPILKSSQEKLSGLQTQLSKLKNLRKSYVKSIELLDANQEISKGNFTVERLRKMTDFYQKRRYELANKVDALDLEKEKLEKQIEDFRFGKGLVSSDAKNTNFNKIILQVMSEKEQLAPFEINYLTRNASWIPSYDLRVSKINTPLELTYKASIRQNTGIDWKQVDLGLSSGRANQYSTKPTLHPWFINYSYKENLQGRRGELLLESQNMESLKESSISDVTEINENELAITFDIAVPYTIFSNGKEHSVSLKNIELPAVYQYYTAPKLDESAYLITKVQDYGKYNLLPGKANIIFEGLYVGKTIVNPKSETDNKMRLSMGRDEKITVTRQQISEKSGTRFLSSKKMQIFTYEITIRNNKNTTINIDVEDQYPISQNKSIEVTLLDSDQAKIDEEKGLLKWNRSLKSGETKKIRFSYEVRYDKDEVIRNL